MPSCLPSAAAPLQGWRACSLRIMLRACLPCCVLLLTTLGLLPSSCTEPTEEGCRDDTECPSGEVCDRSTGRCGKGPDRPSQFPELGRYTSLAAGADGRVWFATRAEGAQPGLVVGWIERGGPLQIELVAEGSGMAEGTSIALLPGPGQQPVVAFHDAAEGVLMLARRQHGRWSVEEVDGGVEDLRVGALPSLALDEEGRPWIAYQDESLGALKVASRTEIGWEVEVADEPAEGEGPRGLYASLVLLSSGPFVAHYDEGAGDLRVSLRERRGWQSSVIAGRKPRTREDLRDEGRFASASVDPFGNAAVAFYDATQGVLKLAWDDRGVMKVEVVDSGLGQQTASAPRPPAMVGQHASLVFGRGGLPGIVYLDAARLDLVYASRSSEGWTRTVLSEEGVAGLWAAQAIDEQGYSVVAHCRLLPGADGRLRHSLEILWP